MLSTLASATLSGIRAVPVSVEVDVSSRGLPGITIVGLPDSAIRESKERVRTVLRNLGFSFRAKKVVINLSPASLQKHGPAFDLPIAVGLLQAYQLIPPIQKNMLYYGELGLDGAVKHTKGTLNALLLAKKQKLDGVVFPASHAHEASLVQIERCFPIQHLTDVVSWASGKKNLPVINALSAQQQKQNQAELTTFLSTYVGQPQALRAAAIAAAGRHHLVLTGTPGIGKTMLARAIPSLLSTLSKDQAIETASIYTSQGIDRHDVFHTPPFRSPHHTISLSAFLGGGRPIKPGEITLAHNGLLFLDELPLFKTQVLNGLIEPLESGAIVHMHAGEVFKLPTRMLLIAVMNPCPCGYHGSQKQRCRCSTQSMKQYRQKLSGPLLDRIDLTLRLDEFEIKVLEHKDPNTQAYLHSIHQAQEFQEKRYKNHHRKTNGELTFEDIEHISISSEAKQFFFSCCNRLSLSTRKYVATLRTARTIADLAAESAVQKPHIAEAVQLCTAQI